MHSPPGCMARFGAGIRHADVKIQLQQSCVNEETHYCCVFWALPRARVQRVCLSQCISSAHSRKRTLDPAPCVHWSRALGQAEVRSWQPRGGRAARDMVSSATLVARPSRSPAREREIYQRATLKIFFFLSGQRAALSTPGWFFGKCALKWLPR